MATSPKPLPSRPSTALASIRAPSNVIVLVSDACSPSLRSAFPMVA